MEWSNKDIEHLIQSKGLSITSLTYTKRGRIDHIYAECSKGHIVSGKRASFISGSAKCSICYGRQNDVPSINETLAKFSFSLQEAPSTKKDRYGNDIVPFEERLKLQCKEGHEFNRRLVHVKADSCSRCKGTHTHNAFSRSEEIIARCLSYSNILYSRQYLTDKEHEELAIDFFLPTLNIFIEYDGSHHVFGRSDRNYEDLELTAHRDSIRDAYAHSVQVPMIRIDHSNTGKALVYRLQEVLLKYGVAIDTNDLYYDTIVREVFDEAHERFGWVSYEDALKSAQVYRYHSLKDSARTLGQYPTVIRKRFKVVYGMGKQEFNEKTK